MSNNKNAKELLKLLKSTNRGLSISITKNTFNRLIGEKPFTSIKDMDDNWEACIFTKDDVKKDIIETYQCKRMSSLFKDIYKDGTVKYTDIGRAYKVNILDPGLRWYSSLVIDVIDEIFPISMPYNPEEPMKVYCKDFLTDRANGDYDVVGILYAIKTENDEKKRIEINRYFKEDSDDEWIEIDKDEYDSYEVTEMPFRHKLFKLFDKYERNE